MTVQERRWWPRLVAVALPLILLAGLDGLLGWTGVVPAKDPLFFAARSFEEGFSPFVATGQDGLCIRPDWVNRGVGLRATQGGVAGRFFLQPGFRDTCFSREKSKGTVRIFVLGGSTTYGLYVGEADSFSGQLRRGLATRFPEISFEVINLGSAGWASTRVLNLLLSLDSLEPDLLVVYSGHNELLPGTVNRGLQPDRLVRLRLWLAQHSTLYSWLDHWTSSLRRGQQLQEVPEDVAALAAGKSLVFDPSNLPVAARHRPSPELLHAARQNLAENISTMVQHSDETGVPVLICLPVANPWVPPTVAAGDLLTLDRGQERRDLLAALASIKEGQPELAAVLLTPLVPQFPTDAALHYWYGVAAARAGRQVQAMAALQSAVDLDVRAHRINSELTTALVNAAGDRLVDLRPVLAASSPGEANRLFLDHCHPTVLGHQRIAMVLLPRVEQTLHLDGPEPATGNPSNPS